MDLAEGSPTAVCSHLPRDPLSGQRWVRGEEGRGTALSHGPWQGLRSSQCLKAIACLPLALKPCVYFEQCKEVKAKFCKEERPTPLLAASSARRQCAQRGGCCATQKPTAPTSHRDLGTAVAVELLISLCTVRAFRFLTEDIPNELQHSQVDDGVQNLVFRPSNATTPCNRRVPNPSRHHGCKDSPP